MRAPPWRGASKRSSRVSDKLQALDGRRRRVSHHRDNVGDELLGLARTKTRDEGEDILLIDLADGVVDDDADVVDDVAERAFEGDEDLLLGYL